ncbi:hypothetical protein [uncultured Amnibacterium sp.]|uniref:hypothetical protein n=1 Tax=uncultured Amnibacterium sp. TaxID=1631851 RepID=UPI0035CC2C17
MNRSVPAQVLRLLLVLAGAVLAVVVAQVRRRPRAVFDVDPTVQEGPDGSARKGLGAVQAARPVARTTQAVRGVLIGIGVLGLAWSAYVLTQTVPPQGALNVAIWLAAAIVLHDGVLSPLAFGANFLLRLVGRRVPAAVLAVVQVAVVVGVVLTLMVLPEIKAKALGPRNPSVVPLDYTLNLVVMWVVLAILAGIVSVIVLRVLDRRSPAHRGPRGSGPAARHRGAHPRLRSSIPTTELPT